MGSEVVAIVSVALVGAPRSTHALWIMLSGILQLIVSSGDGAPGNFDCAGRLRHCLKLRWRGRRGELPDKPMIRLMRTGAITSHINVSEGVSGDCCSRCVRGNLILELIHCLPCPAACLTFRNRPVAIK